METEQSKEIVQELVSIQGDGMYLTPRRVRDYCENMSSWQSTWARNGTNRANVHQSRAE